MNKSPPTAASTTNPVFFTEQEVANRQQRSIKTLQTERIKGGGIPFAKFGRSVRYCLADIEDWENARRMLSTSDAASKEGKSRG